MSEGGLCWNNVNQDEKNELKLYSEEISEFLYIDPRPGGSKIRGVRIAIHHH